MSMEQLKFDTRFDSLSSKENLNKLSNNKFAQIHCDKSLTCEECGKILSTSSSLFLHTERHKNIVSRKTFSCLVDDCKRSFLYICTLKKHFQKEHNKIYVKILDFFPGNQRSFLAIYKYLLSNPESCGLSRLKNKSKELSPELSTRKEISFVIANKSEKKKIDYEKVLLNLKNFVSQGTSLVDSSQKQLTNYFVFTFNLIQDLQNQIQNPSINNFSAKSKDSSNTNSNLKLAGNDIYLLKNMANFSK